MNFETVTLFTVGCDGVIVGPVIVLTLALFVFEFLQIRITYDSLLLQLQDCQLGMGWNIPKDPSPLTQEKSILRASRGDGVSKEEATADDEPDQLYAECHVCQQRDDETTSEEEQGCQGLPRSFVAVEIDENFHQVSQISELKLYRWTKLVEKRFDPILIAMALDQFAPSLDLCLAIHGSRNTCSDSFDRSRLKLAADCAVDDPKVQSSHDMVGVPDNSEVEQPFQGGSGMLPRVDLSQLDYEGLEGCTCDGQALDDTGKVFKVESRRRKVIDVL